MPENLVSKFDKHFQRNFLAAMLRDSEFLSAVVEHVSPEHFSEDSIQSLITLVRQFHAIHGTAPDTSIFREITNQQAAGTFKEDRAKILSVQADDLFAIPLQNNGYMLSEFEKFLRWKKLETTLPDIQDLARAGQEDQWQAKLQEVIDYRQRSKTSDTAKLVDLSGVTREYVHWLWPKRIPVGKLNLLSGIAGQGKSTWLAWLAATVSRGLPWPGETPATTLNQPGGVVTVSAEDDVADTILPRLEAAGADLSKIKVLQGIEYGHDKKERCFDLQKDLPVLEEAIQAVPDLKLVLIDPISAYSGKTD